VLARLWRPLATRFETHSGHWRAARGHNGLCYCGAPIGSYPCSGRYPQELAVAGADELLHDAQYAVHGIGHGDNRENRAQSARAQSIARKILRKYPGSIEAGQAQGILDRLQGKEQRPQFTSLRPGVGGSQRSTSHPKLSVGNVRDEADVSGNENLPQKLLMEAQHALHGSTYGESYDRSKNQQRSKRLAQRVISEHPGSDEAAAARKLLNKPPSDESVSSSVERRNSAESEGPGLLKGFAQLNQNKQAAAVIGSMMLMAVVGVLPVVFGLIVIAMAGPFGKHYPLGTGYLLNGILKKTESWLASNKAR
jgi:hypothetical protein